MGTFRDKLVTNTADVGTGAALSILVAATGSPLALMLAGASLVAFISAWSLKGKSDAAADEAEAQRQFEALVREAGSVRAALQRIADGQAGSSVFIAAKAQEVLAFLNELRQDQAKAMRDHEELAVYIGSKVESYFELMGVTSQARHAELSETTGRIEKMLHDLLDARTLPLGELDRYEAVYRQWLTKTTATLLVPGLGVELSITESSAKLRVMVRSTEKELATTTTANLAAELRRYQEWAGQDERHDSDAIDAVHLREYGDEVVVIGGPGSGKSTLARRIAHTATADDLVVLARLKDVAKLLATLGFTDALATAAFEHSGVTASARHQLLEKTTCIILDGLDETGGRRSSIAEHIRAWRDGHKSCKVIVMTRPVGHDAALLPGWKHIELKKLSAAEARSAAKQMIAAIAPDNLQLIQAVDQALGAAMSSNPAVSLAARNPLLLGFVVHRLSEGGNLPSRRVDLFDMVIKRLATIHSDRDVPSADSLVLRRSLEAAGWTTLSDPDATKDDVIDGIAHKYDPASTAPSLADISRAEKSIEIWEERRIIETLCIGDERAISFVHPALGEYAAACFAARLGSSEYSTWVTSNRLQPRWREVLLMSAALGRCDECIVTLLSLDIAENPAALEAVLAAACVVENQSAPLEAVEEVVRHLAHRLTSTSRLVCKEAADAICSLIPFAQARIVPFITGLQQHEQLWTRRLALALTAACDAASARIDVAEEQIDWLINGRDNDAGGWFARDNHDLRARALQGLLPLAASLKKKGMIEAVVEAWSECELSAEESPKMHRLLVAIGTLPESAEPAYQKRMREQFKSLSVPPSWKDEAKAILVTIAAAANKLCGDTQSAPSSAQPPMMNVARVIGGLNYWKMTLSQICNVDAEAPYAVAMVAATIAATGCEPKLVAAEATELLNAGEDVFSAMTSEKVPLLPTTADWSKAPEWTVAPEFLLQAVSSGSLIISWPAANLIVDRVNDEAVRVSILRSAVERCDSNSVMAVLAAILRELRPEVSLELAVARLASGLDQSTPRLISLFRTLSVGSYEAHVNQVLERALQADVNNAVAASEVLAEVPTLAVPTDKMKEALAFWTANAEPTPESGIVPPSPRSNLITAISRRKGWTLDELANYVRDNRHGFGEAYSAACLEFARQSASSLQELIASVRQGRIPPLVLDEIRLKAPVLVRDIVPQIEECLLHDDKAVRLASLRLLTSAPELAAKAKAYANEALSDTDVSVRDEAIRVLRRSSTGE